MHIPGSYSDGRDTVPGLAAFAAFVRLVEALVYIRIGHYFWKNPTQTAKREGFNRVVRYTLSEAINGTLQVVAWLMLAFGVIPRESSLWVFSFDIFMRSWKLMLGILRHTLGLQEELKFVFNAFLPFHLGHYTERLGVIFIIFLGESIDGICVQGTVYGTVFCAYMIVFCLKLLYFDVAVVDENDHVMRTSPKLFLIWDWLHQFLAVSFVTIGDALALLSERASEAVESQTDDAAAAPDGRTLLCHALGATHLLLAYIGHVHRNPDLAGPAERVRFFSRLESVQIGAQILFGLICFSLASVHPSSLSDLRLMSVLGITFVATVTLNLVDEAVTVSWPRGELCSEAPIMPDVATAEETTCGLTHEYNAQHVADAVAKIMKEQGVQCNITLKELKGVLMANETTKSIEVHGFHAPHLASKS